MSNSKKIACERKFNYPTKSLSFEGVKQIHKKIEKKLNNFKVQSCKDS